MRKSVIISNEPQPQYYISNSELQHADFSQAYNYQS